jgi:hypothetical protein
MRESFPEARDFPDREQPVAPEASGPRLDEVNSGDEE